MKIIDEKGKLFGKINIIDFLAILFLISLTPILYYGYKIATYTPPIAVDYQKLYKTIPIEIVFNNLTEDIIKRIQPNDKEVDENGNEFSLGAEIVKINKVEPNILASGESKEDFFLMIDNIETNRKNVFVTMHLNILIDANNQISYKGSALKPGRTIKFETNKYSITGKTLMQLMQQQGKLIEEKMFFEIDATFGGIPKNAIDVIKVGDKEENLENVRIAEVLEIKDIEPEFYKLNLFKDKPGYSESLKATDRVKITVRLKILIKAQIDNSITFKGVKIAAGQSFLFITDSYMTRGVFQPPPPPPPDIPINMLVKIKAKEVIPEVYTLMKPGDEMKTSEHFEGERSILGYSIRGTYNLIKPDSIMKQGDDLKNKKVIKSIAHIKRIISIESEKRDYYSLKRDELAWEVHPYLKKVIFEVDIFCKESNGICLFDGIPVRVGSIFTFKNEMYQITGNIIEMVKKQGKIHDIKDK